MSLYFLLFMALREHVDIQFTSKEWMELRNWRISVSSTYVKKSKLKFTVTYDKMGHWDMAHLVVLRSSLPDLHLTFDLNHISGLDLNTEPHSLHSLLTPMFSSLSFIFTFSFILTHLEMYFLHVLHPRVRIGVWLRHRVMVHFTSLKK